MKHLFKLLHVLARRMEGHYYCRLKLAYAEIKAKCSHRGRIVIRKVIRLYRSLTAIATGGRQIRSKDCYVTNATNGLVWGAFYKCMDRPKRTRIRYGIRNQYDLLNFERSQNCKEQI